MTLRRPDSAGTYVAPTAEIELVIVSIWEELLGMKPIGVRDDFLAVGGNSLVSLQIFGRLNKAFRMELSRREFFEANTVAEMAALVQRYAGLRSADREIPVGGQLVIDKILSELEQK
jgi:acyl carrier protein